MEKEWYTKKYNKPSVEVVDKNTIPEDQWEEMKKNYYRSDSEGNPIEEKEKEWYAMKFGKTMVEILDKNTIPEDQWKKIKKNYYRSDSDGNPIEEKEDKE